MQGGFTGDFFGDFTLHDIMYHAFALVESAEVKFGFSFGESLYRKPIQLLVTRGTSSAAVTDCSGLSGETCTGGNF